MSASLSGYGEHVEDWGMVIVVGFSLIGLISAIVRTSRVRSTTSY